MNMKAFHKLLIATLLLFAFELNAQDQNYQIKKIDGKEYLLYPVQQGEGLYGIGRKFDISVKELNELNPEWIKIGTNFIDSKNKAFTKK